MCVLITTEQIFLLLLLLTSVHPCRSSSLFQPLYNVPLCVPYPCGRTLVIGFCFVLVFTMHGLSIILIGMSLWVCLRMPLAWTPKPGLCGWQVFKSCCHTVLCNACVYAHAACAFPVSTWWRILADLLISANPGHFLDWCHRASLGLNFLGVLWKILLYCLYLGWYFLRSKTFGVGAGPQDI